MTLSRLFIVSLPKIPLALNCKSRIVDPLFTPLEFSFVIRYREVYNVLFSHRTGNIFTECVTVRTLCCSVTDSVMFSLSLSPAPLLYIDGSYHDPWSILWKERRAVWTVFWSCALEGTILCYKFVNFIQAAVVFDSVLHQACIIAKFYLVTLSCEARLQWDYGSHWSDVSNCSSCWAVEGPKKLGNSKTKT